MSCRLAGAASPDGLWQMLSKGMSGWSQGASSRFKMDAFYHPATEMSGAFNAKGLYLLKQDVSHFDNHFFNISPIEAKAIDPQQRLMLEVAYEAFENAGITSESLSASETGVYCAVSNHDYETMQGRDPELSPVYRFTGTGVALASNRISYYFNLKGPSITVDTACSGSLVAVHEAFQAIRTGEIRQALVGGTNLILDPERISVMSSLQVLSDHGRCYTFDNRANGFGRGEGVAAIVLKPLSDALRDGDPIQAVIRGSVVNSDGKTPGVTMPDQAAQVSMMRRAYAEAGLDPRQTSYIEAHAGTGTQVGDKIESAAIAETFARDQTVGPALYVGSVKTNIGHAESAAGLAGLLKTVLILKNGKIPPNLNFSRANDKIPLHELRIEVPKKLVSWPENQVRRASVNSFGYGGTNAHVILEAPEDYLASVPDASIHQAHPLRAETKLGKRRLFIFTHGDERGMSRMATDLKRYLSQVNLHEIQLMDSLAYTLSTRRSRLAFRLAVGATNSAGLIDALDSIAKGSLRPTRALEDPKICFAFTGQGAQWAGMAKGLLNTYPVFAKAMAGAEKHLLHLGADWSLLKELRKSPENSRVNEAALSQPCCTAIQLGLVDLLSSWGIRPNVVCGHSSGEIAAAYAAGLLSASDALSIAFHRGKAVACLKKQHPELEGGMLAAGLLANKAEEFISRSTSKTSAGTVVVACINSPTSVTISGDMAALKLVQADLERDGVFNRFLQVDVAYHSHHMELVRKEYLAAMGGIKHLESNGDVVMISSVTGQKIHSKAMGPEYWARNMVSPVRFAEALNSSLCVSAETNKSALSVVDIILEVGPHSALAGPIKQTLKASAHDSSAVSYHSILLRNVDATLSAIDMAGGLSARGVDVFFDAINDPDRVAEKKTLTNLPAYNWKHTTSHWNEGRVSTQYRRRQFPRHELLGIPSHDSISTEPTWRNYLRISEMQWLKGHVVNDQLIFPASGHICMVLEALRQTTVTRGRMWKNLQCRFRQVVVERALLIPDNAVGVEIFFTLRKYTVSARELSSDWKEFRIFSTSEKGEATEHCRGLVIVEQQGITNEIEGSQEHLHHLETLQKRFDEAQQSCTSSILPERLYEDLKSIGINYTAPFTNLTRVNSRPNGSFCTLEIPETKHFMPAEYQQPHVLHPATLDTCFQTAFPALMNAGQMSSSFVLSSIDEMEVSSDVSSKPGTELLVQATVEPFGRTKQRAEITIGDSILTQPSLITIRGLGFTSTSSSLISSNLEDGRKLCHRVEWSPDTACATEEDILQFCRVDLPESSSLERRATYDRFIETVIKQVLASIHPADEASMASHHMKLVNWMRAREPKLPIVADPTLRGRVKAFGTDGEMLVHVSDHLIDIIKGKVDPLTVLMKDDLLYRVYSTENAERCHIQLANYLRQLQYKNPQMRILEIGAGTASMTMPIMEALMNDRNGNSWEIAKLDKYVFTDISSGFFEKAKTKLEHWGDLIEFKRLDAEKPIEEQGFVEGSFDLILASNVLHATRTMSNTLTNIRKLLKPGGKLGLVEITELHMVWPMIVGSLPGWWLGEEDGRVDSPLMKLPAWDKALLETGFSGVDIRMKDYEPAYEHQVSLIISTATSDIKSDGCSPILVICNDQESCIADAFSDLMMTKDRSLEIRQSSLGAADPAGKICVLLIDVVSPFLASCGQVDFQKVKHILSNAEGILWVTRGAAVESTNPEAAIVNGLARTLRSEDHSLKIVTLDLDPTKGNPTEMAQQIYTVLHKAFYSGGADMYLSEFEYAVRNRMILIPRIVEDTTLERHVQSSVGKQVPQWETVIQPGRALGLEIETPGLLETFYWADSAVHNQRPNANDVRIEVKMVALNFKDLMNAMGQLEGLSAMLIECSGTVVDVGENARNHFTVGDRVCAIHFDGLGTTSNVDYHLVQKIPDGMPLEVATAVQVSYTTALYALRDVARLQKGESILIHSGAGALGQASIALAKYMGAGDIFVTVGNTEKKLFIMQNFGIPEENIFSSRGLTFGQGIRRKTMGRGVDIVLNSLSGEAARECQSCLARFGRFVELGKKDLLSNARMEMQYLEKNVVFAAVDLTMVAQHKPSDIQELLGTAINLVHTQKVQVLQPITIRPVSELEDAFRLIQSGKHVGKIILNIDGQSHVKVQPQTPFPPKLDARYTYLVVGGLGGIGRAVVKYLAQLGAKHIATLSRSGIEGSNKKEFVKEMRDAGVNLIVEHGSVVKIGDLKKLKERTKQWPIRGVVQGAMVLEDSIVSNMTYAQWQASLAPKVTGTLNIEAVLGDSLDFFILLSSGCGIVGSRGQGNYGAGSTFQDAFSRYRASMNLPVRTLDLGVVDSEGYTAESKSAAAHAQRQGVNNIKLEEIFALLDHAISNPIPADAAGAQVLVGTKRADPASGTDESAAQRPDPIFSHIWITRSRQDTSKPRTSEIDISAVLRAAATQKEAVEAVQVAIVGKLSHLLAMPVEEISHHQSVSSYGADSLIMVELRNWVAKQLEAHVQIFELMSALSIHGLAKSVAERSRLVPPVLF
ncbi:polyketide synthase, partial [Leptodontidium sp. 2 PMI_412]